MTIGETLKRARKKMGLELDDVVRATKIAKMFLIALENDDISSLPQGVYTRNFLRTYAKFLKLDEDILTAEYHDQYSIKPQFVTQQEQTKLDNQRFLQRRNRRMVGFSIMIAIPLALFFLYLQFQETFDQFFGDLFKTSTRAPVTTNRGPEKPNSISSSLMSDEDPPLKTLKSEVTEVDPVASESVEADSDPAPDEKKQEDGGVEKNDSAQPSTAEDEPPPEAAPEDVDEPLEELSLEQEVPQLEVGLPLTDVDGITFYPEGERPTQLEETFVIAGRTEAVWLQVYIDGVEISNRRLLPGQVRCYKYGQLNTVVIGDAYQVSVQDGHVFRERAHDKKVYVKLEDFGPGEFMTTLDASIEQAMARMKEMQE